jgi:hypothetical protein
VRPINWCELQPPPFHFFA